MIYLDFNGHTVTGTAWNDAAEDRPAVASYACLPYDTNGDFSTLDHEQQEIWEIWSSVAEDFRPFDVNVTTVEPAEFTSDVIRVLVTRSTDAAGTANPSSHAAGVSYLDVFGADDFASYSPVFIYADRLGAPENIAIAAAHEAGHYLGLSHDGQAASETESAVEYYAGHGWSDSSWGPIMGAPYGRSLSQWSMGQYYRGNNTEDDLAELEQRLGRVEDDHGDEFGLAAGLRVTGTSIQASGVIAISSFDAEAGATRKDVDAFVFTVTSEASYNFVILPHIQMRGRNLDIIAELYRSDGTRLVSSDTFGQPGTHFSGGLPAGTYYLTISGTGFGMPMDPFPWGYTDYGSLGQYHVSGVVYSLAPVVPEFHTEPAATVAMQAGEPRSIVAVASGNPAPAYQWQRRRFDSESWENIGSGGEFSGANTSQLEVVEPGLAMNGNSFRCVATNSEGSVISQITTLEVEGPPDFVSRPLSRALMVGQNATFTAEAVAASDISYQWRHNREDIAGATSSTFSIEEATLADTGYYELVATSAEGSSRSYFHVTVVPRKLALQAWGSAGDGAHEIPAGLGELLAIDAGWHFGMALTSSGTIAAWGQSFYGQTQVPEGLAEVVAIAAGNEFGLALRQDGTLVGWGGASWGGTGPGADVPAGIKDAVAISAGSGRAAALRANGRVALWGFGGDATQQLHDIVAIDYGAQHGLGVRADGTVVGWGSNFAGEATPPANLTDVIAVAAAGMSYSHSLALKSDGTVVAWGSNYFGQCDVPTALNDVVSIGAGDGFSVALKKDGTIVAWGQNEEGQLETPTGAQGIAVGWSHGLALVDAVAPAIVSSSEGRIVNVGDSARFSVAATGTGPLAYQWKRNGQPVTDSERVSGATTATLQINNAEAGDIGEYTVDVSNAAGLITSSVASLFVATPTPFAARPKSRLVVEGQSVSFSVELGGAGPFTYEWRHNRRTIVGAATSTLYIVSAEYEDRGFYEVFVTNAEGGLSRSVVYLNVAIENPVLTTWGDYAVPPPLITDPVADITSTPSLALLGDGRVIGWRSNTWWGEFPVPDDLVDVVAISSGRSGHCLALKADGTVVGWGTNFDGESNPPEGLKGVVAIASGTEFSLALKADGTVVSWGGSSIPPVPAGLRDVVAIAGGFQRAFAIKSDGSVVKWGYDSAPVPSGLEDVVQIAADFDVLALRGNGSVLWWGSYDYSSPEGLVDITEVSIRGLGLALKSDGTVVAWGSTPAEPSDVPAGLGGVVKVAAGTSPLVLGRSTTPEIVVQPTGVTVTTGDYVAFTVAARGSVPITYQWRRDGVDLSEADGVVGATSPTLVVNEASPAQAGRYDVLVSNAAGEIWSEAAELIVRIPPQFTQRPLSRVVLLGESVTIEATTTDTLPVSYHWKRNGRVIPGATGASLVINPVTRSDGGYYEVVASNAVASAISVFTLQVSAAGYRDMTVLPWGRDDYGASGPTGVPIVLNGVVAMDAGRYHAVALKDDGTLVGWGLNFFGGLSFPTDFRPVAAVLAGEYNTLALTTDGRVWSWGNYASSPLPVPVDLRNVVAIAGKGRINLALKSDGTVVSWGVAAPPSLAAAVGIAAGRSHALALKADGTVVAWGSSSNGATEVPSGLSDVVAIAAGDDHSLALKADGTVVAWGRNDVGQSTVPPGLSGVVALAGGFVHSIALKEDGSVVGWGRNVEGQVNPVPASIDVQAISAGDYYNLLLVPIRPPQIEIHPEPQTVVAGRTATFSVTATGTRWTYQWRRNGQPLADNDTVAGSQTRTLRIFRAKAEDAGTYDVVVTNSDGTKVASNGVPLTVQIPPELNVRPMSRIAAVGSSASFTAQISGSMEALTFEWRRNGQVITGANSATLNLESIAYSDGGVYELLVSDGTSVNRSVFVLTVRGVRTDGAEVRMWGNTSSQAAIPTDLGHVVALAAGQTFNIALKAEGAVAVWGVEPQWSSSNIGVIKAHQLGDVVAVAAGEHHGIALHANGTVSSIGEYVNDAKIVRQLNDVVSVTAGIVKNYALLTDGTVAEWFVDGGEEYEFVPGFTDIVRISAAANYVLGLKSDGTVVAHGNMTAPMAVPSSLEDVVGIAAASTHAVALRANGTVVTWGENWQGNLETTVGDIVVPTGLSGVVALDAESHHSIALTHDGTLSNWSSLYWRVASPPAEWANRVLAAAAAYSHGVALVAPPPQAATFVTQPAVVRVNVGREASFSVAVGGTPPFNYKWEWSKDGGQSWQAMADDTVHSGTASPMLVVSRAAPEMDGWRYRCVVSNPTKTEVISASAWLRVERASTDLNQDGWSDVVWQNESTGQKVLWWIRNGQQTGAHVELGTTPPEWEIVGAGDFNSDGQIDLVGQNRDTGVRGVWLNIKQTPLDETSLHILAQVSLDWTIACIEDFNGDRKPDLVWQNAITGERGLWLMDGTQLSGGFVSFATISPEWTIAAAGDFNGDDFADLALQNVVTGQRQFWLMQGASRKSIVDLGSIPVDWSIAGAGDYNGDTEADLLWEQRSTGRRGFWLMEGTALSGGFVDLTTLSHEWVAGASAQKSGAPAITTQPEHATIAQQAGVTLLVRADGARPLGYQWFHAGRPIAGANKSTHIIDRAGWSHAGEYTVEVSNSAGRVTSRPARVSVVRPVSNDLDGDGQSDLVWQNSETGQRVLWAMDGLQQRGPYSDLGTIPPEWCILGMGDLNGDGRNDLLWHNRASGEVGAWWMNGSERTSELKHIGFVSAVWRGVGVDDFDGDGASDIIWENDETGERSVWLMEALSVREYRQIAFVTPDWHIAGAGDFNGDTKPDLLWQNESTGQRSLWLMDGTQFWQGVELGTVPLDWSMGGVGDFDADGKMDILWENLISGRRGAWLMNGVENRGFVDIATLPVAWRSGVTFTAPTEPTLAIVQQPAARTTVEAGESLQLSVLVTGGNALSYQWYRNGAPIAGANDTKLVMARATWLSAGEYFVQVSGATGHVDSTIALVEVRPASLDLNGDGKPDLLWENATDGQRVLWLMDGIVQQGAYVHLGWIPVDWAIAGAADFNDDGHTDLLWQNKLTGQRGFWLMKGTNLSGDFVPLITVSTDWHIAGTGDFNGDGNVDVVLENTVTGQRGFWLLKGTALLADFVPFLTVSPKWRIAGVGDFNSDGKPDMVLEHENTGQRGFWLMDGIQLLQDFVHLAHISIDWNIAGAADFNGDGDSDLLWQNSLTGQRGFWLMSDTKLNSDFLPLGILPVEWEANL